MAGLVQTLLIQEVFPEVLPVPILEEVETQVTDTRVHSHHQGVGVRGDGRGP